MPTDPTDPRGATLDAMLAALRAFDAADQATRERPDDRWHVECRRRAQATFAAALESCLAPIIDARIAAAVRAAMRGEW